MYLEWASVDESPYLSSTEIPPSIDSRGTNMVHFHTRTILLSAFAIAGLALFAGSAPAQTPEDWARVIQRVLDDRLTRPHGDDGAIIQVVGAVRCNAVGGASCPPECQNEVCSWESVESLLRSFAAERGARVVPVSRDRPPCNSSPMPTERPRGWKLEVSLSMGVGPFRDPSGQSFDQVIHVSTRCETGGLVGGSIIHTYGVAFVDGEWLVAPLFEAVS